MLFLDSRGKIPWGLFYHEVNALYKLFLRYLSEFPVYYLNIYSVVLKDFSLMFCYSFLQPIYSISLRDLVSELLSQDLV